MRRILCTHSSIWGSGVPINEMNKMINKITPKDQWMQYTMDEGRRIDQWKCWDKNYKDEDTSFLMVLWGKE